MNPDPKKPAQFAPDVKWHPVRRVTFTGPTMIAVVGLRTDLLGDITQTNVARWTIEYGPSWRHFRITTHALDSKHDGIVQMVPEASIRSWEPMT